MNSDDPTNRDSMLKDPEVTSIPDGDAGSTAFERSTAQTGEGRAPDPTMNLLVVIEDDPDVQFLVEAIFATDPRFNVLQVAESAEDALAAPATTSPGVIVLDHGLAGPLPGLAAAALLKEKHPQAKIILFTAHAAVQARAEKDPSIDAFLLKTKPDRLLPLAQHLTGLTPTKA
jgi:DNA-binding NtrC family response regulator